MRESILHTCGVSLSKDIPVSLEEEVKMRRSFEFGAYLLIIEYISKTYGINELEKFARFWSEIAANPDRRAIIARSKEEFLAFEAKIEQVWVGRKIEKLDSQGYVGVTEKCPIRLLTNKYCADLPKDYFCHRICTIIYPDTYKLLGLKSSLKIGDEGCRLSIEC